eukprot:TRINITY_DN2668_c0_g1_i2.p2 TRINITY_DN2668_c0_g1~~TRINITY_DN2668_c0_g1_i2.p2  ORF type:complete len:188 (+),score=17.61 TRINITY_DN2668_c0_g1_i2:356-919(+)
MNDIRGQIDAAFQQVTSEGFLCGESLRQVRINIIDATLSAEAQHREGRQINLAARRCYYGCQYVANPRLLEPIYVAEITAPLSEIGGVYQCLGESRGDIIEESHLAGIDLSLIRANLPVVETFGFSSRLRQYTSGKAFCQYLFDRWSLVEGNPLEKDSKAYQIVMSVRKRKGFEESMPELYRYSDNL